MAIATLITTLVKTSLRPRCAEEQKHSRSMYVTRRLQLNHTLERLGGGRSPKANPDNLEG